MRWRSSSLCVMHKRYAKHPPKGSRSTMINYFEYAQKSKAMSTIKLKYGTENETKRKYLTESRHKVDGSMEPFAKYMFALKEKRNQINYKRSISILKQCISDGFQPNLVLYSKVLDNCSKSSAPNMVVIKIFEEMIRNNLKPNYIIFSSVLNKFYKHKCYQDVIVLFGLTAPTLPVDLSPLLQHYTKSREISYVLNNKMMIASLKEIECNLICFNIVLKCIGYLGDMTKVNECFQAVIKADKMPNDVTLNTIINIFGRNEKMDKMQKMFDWWMKNRQLLTFAPDIVTINTMLGAYAKCCQFDKCEALFNKHCSRENKTQNTDDLLKPNEITFSHMLSCIGNCLDHDIHKKEQMRDDALKYYKQMQVIYGIEDKYNACTTALMNVCVKCNDLMTLMTVFEERKQKDYRDRQMYNIAIRGLFYQGMIGEALSLFEEGVEQQVIQYLSGDKGPYCMDLHNFDVASAVIAVMHNLKTLCNVITSRGRFKVPSIWIVVGRGKHVEVGSTQASLRDVLPEMLRDERLFNPTLDNSIPEWNQGIIKLEDESLLNYLAHQLKMDSDELRPRFPSLA
eukprot:88612_1